MWIPSTFSRLPFRSLTFWSLTWCNTSEKNYETLVRHWLSFFLLAKTAVKSYQKVFEAHPPLRKSASTPYAFALCAHRPPTLLQNRRDPYNVRWDVSRRLMHTFWIWDVSRRLMHTFFWLQNVFEFFYNEFGCKNVFEFFLQWIWL